MEKGKLAEKIKAFRYPLLILLIGLCLMLFPGSKDKAEGTGKDESLSAVLSVTEGVGKTYVLVSDTGVVVACSGADSAEVRLDIIRAVRSYTGFGSDRITILKLAE